MGPKKAIIIGAGPAGLTAAYELLKRTDIIPIILEKSEYIGGISRTINYKGNRMDMGPHRFFSKSDRVMDWWLKIMPIETTADVNTEISYQNKTRTLPTNTDPVGNSPVHKKDPEHVMLVIQRLTRIYFLRKFFAYPIQLGLDTLRTLGLIRTIKILFSFLYVRLFPRKPEKSLEDFIINKFGRQLYLLFFKDYTEKVWGVPCHEISAEWGAQRIKGVSLSKAVAEAIKSLVAKKKGAADLHQKTTETSLIEQFLYPKHGPGSLWEEVARQVQEMGGKIYMNQDVERIYTEENGISFVNTVNSHSGQTGAWQGDYFFSTMPVQELIAGMGDSVPEPVREVAAGLQYRDFINVGILLKKLSDKDGKVLELKDNWIYIQERDVKVGRLMIYNNWGTGMIKDPNTTWIGMEYFCNKTDAFWALSDHNIQAAAIKELIQMELCRVEDVLDITVRRMEKTYPAYFGTYDRFDTVKAYTDTFENLFLVGRNGMHKYNNADHSMLTAMVAVDNIIAGVTTKTNLWSINTEQEYHEEKTEAAASVEAETRVDERATKRQEQATKRPSGVLRYLSAPNFASYLWRDKRNRAYLLFALAAYLVQFILFKFRYPYANYMPDSYSYLEAAYTNADVNMWPVAYSKFLRMVSVFTHSDKIVVGLQYFFMQASSLLFLFSLLYFLKPGKVVKNALFAFFLFSPLPLYISNYISADALFIGLSLCWFTTLVWILYKPNPWLIVWQAVLLLGCFTVRYNAIYYPLIALLVLGLSRQPWKYKLASVVLGAALVGISFFYTHAKMKETTGKGQFSAFGGWQLANNALYMYEHIPAAQRGPVPARFARLETMVREHMDTLEKVKLTAEDTVNSFFYLWNGKGPLISYMVKEYKKDSTTPYFKRWASEGPLYTDYALYLMKKYPTQFASNFLAPNAVKYLVPPTEFLGTYNMGGDSVGQVAKDWFNYKSLKVKEHNNKTARIGLTEWYPMFGTMINVLLVLGAIGLLFLNGLRWKENGLAKLLLVVGALWLLNAAFSIFASPVVLRYQAFSLLIYLAMASLVIERIYRMATTPETITPTTPKNKIV